MNEQPDLSSALDTLKKYGLPFASITPIRVCLLGTNLELVELALNTLIIKGKEVVDDESFAMCLAQAKAFLSAQIVNISEQVAPSELMSALETLRVYAEGYEYGLPFVVFDRGGRKLWTHGTSEELVALAVETLILNGESLIDEDFRCWCMNIAKTAYRGQLWWLRYPHNEEELEEWCGLEHPGDDPSLHPAAVCLDCGSSAVSVAGVCEACGSRNFHVG